MKWMFWKPQESKWQLSFVFCLASLEGRKEELCYNTRVETNKEQLVRRNFCIKGIFDVDLNLGLSFQESSCIWLLKSPY